MTHVKGGALALMVALAGQARADEPFAEGMVSITFDDSALSQYDNAFPAMAKRGIRGTFYLITHNLEYPAYITSERALEIAAQGSEVGSHTVHHPQLTSSSDSERIQELSGSQEALVALGLTGVPSFAAPYGAYDDRVLELISRFYRSHRTIDVHRNYRDTSHFHLGSLTADYYMPAAQLLAAVDQAVAERSWLILTFHEIVPGAAVAPGQYSLTAFSEVLDHLVSRGVRVVTVGEGLTLMRPAPAVPPTTPIQPEWRHFSAARGAAPVVLAGRYAQRITETADAAYHSLDDYATARPAGTWEVAAVARADSRTSIFLLLGDGVAYPSAGFDLSAGKVEWVNRAGLQASVSMDALGDGWYRCRLIVGLLDDRGAALYPGDGVSGLHLADATLARVSPPVLEPEWLHPAGVTVQPTVAFAGRDAQKLTESAAREYHDLDDLSTTRAVGTWELTTIAHAGERTKLFLLFGDGVAYPSAGFDLSAGKVEWVNSAGLQARASIDSLGDGWYRCHLIVGAIAPVDAIVGLLDDRGAALYSGDGASGVYLASANLASLWRHCASAKAKR